MNSVNQLSLLLALQNMLGVPETDATCEVAILQGGTVGEVCRASGHAVTPEGTQPYRLVVKTQRRWERYGDPGCWRREYDIYKARIQDELPDMIQLLSCYLLEEERDLTRIWIEYVDGATRSAQLHVEELALTAERLGCFQAQYHRCGRMDWPWIRPYPAVRSSYGLW